MIYHDTVFHRKMSHILYLFGKEEKIMTFEVRGVFSVLNGVTRSLWNIFNTWLTSATPIFDFQVVSNFIFPIKIYWGIY